METLVSSWSTSPRTAATVSRRKRSILSTVASLLAASNQGLFLSLSTSIRSVAAQLQGSSNCANFLFRSDLNQNEKLDRTEFVRATNQLIGRTNVDDIFDIGLSFANIPPGLQQTFHQLSSCQQCEKYQNNCCQDDPTEEIDISGAAPHSNPTSDQVKHLAQICSEIYTAVNRALFTSDTTDSYQGGNISFPIHSTTKQLQVPVAAPTPSPQQCTIALVISDRDRNDILVNSEYVLLVNRLSGNAFPTVYDDLPSVLQTNFDLLATNGGMNVTGSKPGSTPTDAQQANLDTI